MTDPERVADPVTEEVVRRRFLTIQAARLGGIACVLLAILAVNHAIALPAVGAYALLALGIVGFAVAPVMLARRWKTPRNKPTTRDQAR